MEMLDVLGHEARYAPASADSVKGATTPRGTSSFTTPPQIDTASSGSAGLDATTDPDGAVPGVESYRPATPPFIPISVGSGFAVEQPRDARVLKVLEESRHRMLSATDIRTLLLSPDPFTERPDTGTPDWAVFKECPKQRRRAKKSDRWANSGGMKGSRDLPYNSACPFVRRRYGSVFAHNDPHAKGKRYYEYTLLHQRDDGTTYEDKSATLLHILPGPGETDRGRRAVASCDEAPRNRTRTAAPARQQKSAPRSCLSLQVAAETAPRFHLGPKKSAEPPAVAMEPFAGMDMLSAVAALRALSEGSETP